LSTEIYYFSGTGNSLHVAKELQKRIAEVTLIPIISLLKRDIIETNAETVGFVFPIYLTTVPKPVRMFLKKLELKSATYIFSIVTRIGTLCLANIYMNRILKKKGRSLDSYFILNMGSNTPTGLKPTGDQHWAEEITEEKIAELETEVQDRLDLIQNIIINREKYPGKHSTSILNRFLEYFFSSLTENIKKEIHFYPDSDCNGCGICEKVCLAKKIKMVNGKPEWQKNVQCYFCYACFNFCPKQSILVKNLYVKKQGRYYHPEISANDIAGQKLF
jgi:formate hydrogenlyase subunit 6/NADH:ubiquinone oxidoreductase subunit I